MTTTSTTAIDAFTLSPLVAEDISCTTYVVRNASGSVVGEVFGTGGCHLPPEAGRRFRTFWFATLAAAATACVQYSQQGCWSVQEV